VVLVDELDRVLEMGRDYVFMDSFFYALLNRKQNKLGMITASKRPLYEIFGMCQKRFGEDLGSPYFVHFRPIRVGLFDSQEVVELVEGVSAQSGCSLAADRTGIVRLGGYFPHFLQIACFLVYQARLESKGLSKLDWTCICRDFENQVKPYYDYFWQNFTVAEREIIINVAARDVPERLPVDSQLAYRQKLAANNSKLVYSLLPFAPDIAASDINSKLFGSVTSGELRSDEVSDWLWTILRRPRNQRQRLFSTSFELYVRSKTFGPTSFGMPGRVPELLSTISGNLRKHFQNGPPKDEAEVQRALALVLDAAGYEFTREGEQFPFSLKRWRPDHTSLDGVAIEVKLCRTRESLPRIIEEISADIVPYRSRFEALIVVVYDIGNIHDEARFRADFERFPGVYVLVRKH